MKTIVVAVLFSACAFGKNPTPAACGPAGVKFKISRDKSQHPTPPPTSGKSVVYLLGAGTIGIDGKWVGAVDGTYSLWELDPGEHHLCALFTFYRPLPPFFKTKVISAHSLDARAGGTYYFYAYDNPREWDDFTLKQLDPDEGARIVSEATFSTSHPK